MIAFVMCMPLFMNHLIFLQLKCCCRILNVNTEVFGGQNAFLKDMLKVVVGDQRALLVLFLDVSRQITYW